MLAPQAKLWPASDEVAAAALSLLSLSPDDVLADFGCGSGVALLLAVQRFGCRGAVGYEINAERALATRAAVAAAGLAGRVAVHARNALEADDGAADGTTCVYLYLIARGLALLLPLLRRIAARQPGRALRVVSVLYRIPGERHAEMRKVYSGAGGLVMTQLYLYSIAADAPGAGAAGAGAAGAGAAGAGAAGGEAAGEGAGAGAGAEEAEAGAEEGALADDGFCGAANGPDRGSLVEQSGVGSGGGGDGGGGTA
jgi:hypothetical protein